MAKGYKTGGRKAGTPNKLSANVKAAILAAFDKVGGSEYLEMIAKTKPDVFCRLLGQVLPLTITAEVEHRYVVRAPAFIADADQWSQEYRPPAPTVQ